MSEEVQRSRHEYSLLELCGRIHGAWNGAGEGIPTDEAKKIRDWLSWRIEAGWGQSSMRSDRTYDSAVYMLCRTALNELRLYSTTMDVV